MFLLKSEEDDGHTILNTDNLDDAILLSFSVLLSVAKDVVEDSETEKITHIEISINNEYTGFDLITITTKLNDSKLDYFLQRETRKIVEVWDI